MKIEDCKVGMVIQNKFSLFKYVIENIGRDYIVVRTRRGTDKPYLIWDNDMYYFTEYKEPRIYIKYVFWYKDNLGHIRTILTENNSYVVNPDWTHLKTDKIEYTE